jgi:hypothetical protein
VSLTRTRRTLRLAAALAVACLSLLVFASAHGGDIAKAATPDVSASCPPEVASCAPPQQFPCPDASPGTQCSITAGPVTNVGQNQSVYIEVTGVPVGDILEVAYCSLVGGTAAEPQCAAQIPQYPNGNPPGTLPEEGTPAPQAMQYQYGTVTSTTTVLAMPTEYDPDTPGNSPIVSQTGDQFYRPDENGIEGSFFCDNGANPCAVEVMDIPQGDALDVSGDGFPPQPPDVGNGYSAAGLTAIFPLTFSPGASGCGSAPLMQVDASYSAAQFLPAAAEATCNGPGGVAPIATVLPSVDNPGCASGTYIAGCPIYDVIDGDDPVSFTDDPEDPATQAEEKAAGGKLAYIPIAASATEIAFTGGAGEEAGQSFYPLDSYQLTPAQAAGIMTQLWTQPFATVDVNDDVCAQLPAPSPPPKGWPCVETKETQKNVPLQVEETANKKTDNLDVSQAVSNNQPTTPVSEEFDTYDYGGPHDTFNHGPPGDTPGTKTSYFSDTGYALLNPWPFGSAGSPIEEDQFGAYFPSTPSGASFETTGWMCGAPNSPYTVNLPWPSGGSATLSDLMSGQQILADAEQGPVPTENNPNSIVDQNIVSPANECQAVSELPTDFAANQSVNLGNYGPSSSPLTAAHAMSGAEATYFKNGYGGFAFTAMDSSEADFYGLLPASLENAAGAFVAPSAQSITAALNDATQNPDGTLSPNFDDTGDPAAYPLPMVTYALVSTNPQSSATQATYLKDLLTNLVTYSHNGGTSSKPLPSGYVPLPASLYTQALTDIAKDVVSPGGSGGSGGSGSGGSNGSNGPGGAPGATGPGGGAAAVPGGSGGPAGAGRGSFGPSGGHGTATTGATSSGGSGGGSSPANFVGHLITVTVGDSRYFVPALLALALLCLLAGPLLYMSPTLRKKMAGPPGDGGAEGADGGAEDATGRGPPESG